jgi:hypothetical protein
LLRWLLKNNIRNYKSVANVIVKYYSQMGTISRELKVESQKTENVLPEVELEEKK